MDDTKTIPKLDGSIGSADGRSAERLEKIVVGSDLSERRPPSPGPSPYLRKQSESAETLKNLRIIGAIIGLASIFLAWNVATSSATYGGYGYVGSATASASLVDMMGQGNAGVALGGFLFVLGCLAALFSVYGVGLEVLGLLITVPSMSSSTTMQVSGMTVSAHTSPGLGVGAAAVSVLLLVIAAIITYLEESDGR